MIKHSFFTAGLITVGVVSAVGVGVASAATGSSTNSGNIGTSGIPRTVFKQDKLNAEAQLLNTTTANIQSAYKNKTLKTLISNAGLTKATYAEKVKADLTTDLENAGYSQDQVTIALQHKTIVRLRHHNK